MPNNIPRAFPFRHSRRWGLRKSTIDLPSSDIYYKRQRLIDDYSDVCLMYSPDQPPGISGLAGCTLQVLQNDYCAVLWKRDLVNGTSVRKMRLAV